jgi:hypothetical protein
MQISAPIIISTRLLPAIRIGECTVSIECTGREADGKLSVKIYFDRSGKRPIVDSAFRTGCGAQWNESTVSETFRAIVSFASAAVDARDHRIGTGREFDDRADTCETLFPRPIVRYFADHSDELDILSLALAD